MPAVGEHAEDMLSQPAAPNRPYAECADMAELQKQVESHLEQYNLMSTKKMDLVCPSVPVTTVIHIDAITK